LSIGAGVDRHPGDIIEREKDTTMQYCLLMHYQEGPDIGLTD
jgi:hypothetical protein